MYIISSIFSITTSEWFWLSNECQIRVHPQFPERSGSACGIKLSDSLREGETIGSHLVFVLFFYPLQELAQCAEIVGDYVNINYTSIGVNCMGPLDILKLQYPM